MPACKIDDCDLRHCTRCRACMPWHHAEATLCSSCECDVEAEENDTMPRFAPQPDDPDCDDSIPEHALKRMAELEKLCRDQHTALGPTGEPLTYQEWSALDRRARELLDLDPPGFDPSTEGP